jgi:hypothetical protein
VIGPGVVPISGNTLIAGSFGGRSGLAAALPAIRVSGLSRGVPNVLFRLAQSRLARLTVGHFSFGQPTTIGADRAAAMRHRIPK